jgi:hypothetical protein
MKTMNIPLYHDGGSARSICQVDVRSRLYVTLAGKRIMLAIHKPHDGNFNPVLADYRSGNRGAMLSQRVVYISTGVKPDLKALARQAINELIEKHGEEKMLAVFQAADRLN